MDQSNHRDGRPGGDEENIQVMDWDTLESTLDSKVKLVQYQDQKKLKQWVKAFKQITLADGTHWYCHGLPRLPHFSPSYFVFSFRFHP